MGKREFKNQITEEFVTMHLMHERGLGKMPVDMFIGSGFDLFMKDKKKYKAIVKAYEIDIQRCVKKGMGDRKGFKYRSVEP